MPYLAFRVSVPFSRKHPQSGEMLDYSKGDLIGDPVVRDDILGSDHAVFGHKVMLEDDHYAVAPHVTTPPAPSGRRSRE